MERRTTLTTTEARQASPRKMNLRVLIVSMLLAIAAGALLYTAYMPSGQGTQHVKDSPVAR